VFGWLSANYLMGTLDPKGITPTRGIVEMGGASMQLTYVPDTIPPVGVDHDKLVEISVLGTWYKLYTHSYLGYGLEAVQERHQHTSAIVDAVDLMGNPCYPRGYHHSSIGNWTLCHEWLASVVPLHTDVKCPFGSCGIELIYQPLITSEPFYAIENFFYTSEYFKVHHWLPVLLLFIY
jgi:apyrase